MSYINETVSVNAFYFAGRGGRMFPRQIELDNTQYNFRDGLQYVVRNGERTVRLFDMTDGEKTYRLRHENGSWTLVGTR